MRTRNVLTILDIEEARRLLAGLVDHTELYRSECFSQAAGCEVYFKTENRQRTGSFKVRGAYVALTSLSAEQQARGVIAASAGNHAQGVALAASTMGVPATIVMPVGASLTKVLATKRYGARVILHGDCYDDACDQAVELQEREGLTFIHPFDNWQVMAGQGTIGLEILEDLPDVDVVVVPVGGGGLVAGIATAIKGLSPHVKVIGVQAAGADSFVRSFKAGEMQVRPRASTIADGIAVGKPGELTFGIVRELVDDMVGVADGDISHAIVQMLEREKLLVEGAGAVGLAALLTGKVECLGRKVAVVLSGGNIDINLLARTIEYGLTAAGRYIVLRVRLTDRPGELFRLLEPLTKMRANILDVQHFRAGWQVPVGQAEVQLTLETQDQQHGEEIVVHLCSLGHEVWQARTPRELREGSGTRAVEEA